jgi:F-type H+-transporting ATPase subunit b
MTLVATHFAADSGSGIGALGINGKAFIIQLVTFLLAYFILRKYAFGPILKVMKDRRDLINSGVSLGEQMIKDKAELEAKVEKALHDARKQADGILAEATESGRQAIRDAEENAKSKADNILKDAAAKTEQEARRVRKAIEKEVVGLISDATETIVGEKVDATKDAALIDRALKGRQAA